VRAEDVERLSPYATPHLKRFGKYPEDFGTGELRPPTADLRYGCDQKKHQPCCHLGWNSAAVNVTWS